MQGPVAEAARPHLGIDRLILHHVADFKGGEHQAAAVRYVDLLTIDDVALLEAIEKEIARGHPGLKLCLFQIGMFGSDRIGYDFLPIPKCEEIPRHNTYSPTELRQRRQAALVPQVPRKPPLSHAREPGYVVSRLWLRRTTADTNLLRALHTIDRYPLDLSHPIFARYPAMKFGERRAVEYFAELLSAEANALRGDVLVSPPIRRLPSGANLVCEALHKRLGLDMEVLRLTDPPDAFESEAEFAKWGDYAKLDFATRASIEPDEDVAFDHARLRGRTVIFVNDINVTGSQMRRIAPSLERAQPRAIHWLLILKVVPEVGRRYPHLESEINHSRYAKSDELIDFLRRADLTPTCKFVARLLTYGRESWARMCRSLDASRRRAIREAILAEGAYSGPLFREKIAML